MTMIRIELQIVMLMSSLITQIMCLLPCDEYVNGCVSLIMDARHLTTAERKTSSNILKSIWDNFDTHEDEALEVFTTVILYNTKYLRNKTQQFNFEKRFGMLNLYRSIDIEKISYFSGIDFVEHRERLNEYSDEVINATVGYFKHSLLGQVCSFENVIKIYFEREYTCLKQHQIETPRLTALIDLYHKVQRITFKSMVN